MKTARELFKLEDFSITLDNDSKLVYELPVGLYQTVDCVIFYKKEKTYEVQAEHAYTKIDLNLHKAINKQLQELGW